MDTAPPPDHDVWPMTRTLLRCCLTLTGLVLVVAATVVDQIGSGDAQALAVILMVLLFADVALQRRPQG